MFCSYCGTEINDDAVFCFKCGKKVSGEIPEEEQYNAENSNKRRFTLLGKDFYLEEGLINYSNLLNEYVKTKYRIIENAQEIYVRCYGDVKDIFGKCEMMRLIGIWACNIMAESCVEMLSGFNLYTVKQDDFINRITNVETSVEVYAANLLNSAIEDAKKIKQYEEEAKYARQLRKRYRHLFVGGGFGIKGAAKGIVTAEIANSITGVAHSLVNAVGNSLTNSTVNKMKKELFAKDVDADEFFEVLDENMHEIINGAFYEIMQLTNKEKIKMLHISDTEKAEAIMENIYQGRCTEEVKAELLYEAACYYPLGQHIYRYIGIYYGKSEYDNIKAIWEALGYDIKEYVTKYVDAKNNYKELVHKPDGEIHTPQEFKKAAGYTIDIAVDFATSIFDNKNETEFVDYVREHITNKYYEALVPEQYRTIYDVEICDGFVPCFQGSLRIAESPDMMQTYLDRKEEFIKLCDKYRDIIKVPEVDISDELELIQSEYDRHLSSMEKFMDDVRKVDPEGLFTFSLIEFLENEYHTIEELTKEIVNGKKHWEAEQKKIQQKRKSSADMFLYHFNNSAIYGKEFYNFMTEEFDDDFVNKGREFYNINEEDHILGLFHHGDGIGSSMVFTDGGLYLYNASERGYVKYDYSEITRVSLDEGFFIKQDLWFRFEDKDSKYVEATYLLEIHNFVKVCNRFFRDVSNEKTLSDQEREELISQIKGAKEQEQTEQAKENEEVKTAFCVYCGNKIKRNIKFCNYCGKENKHKK